LLTGYSSAIIYLQIYPSEESIAKKLLVLTLTLMMLLGLASVSMANTLYFDITNGGEVDLENNSGDLSQTSIGANITSDDLKFGFDYSSGTVENDTDALRLLFKGGHALVDDKQARFDITAGYYNRELSNDYYDEEASFYSFLIGFDARINFETNAWVELSYNYGLAPEMELSNDTGYLSQDADSLSLLNCKFNYLFSEKLGGSIGYQSEIIDYNDVRLTVSGLTVGLFYNF